jgi:dethiobiotin synthetase
MSAPGLFIVGTDTGVGKTVIACALLHYLRDKGVNVGAFKPVESGGRQDSAMLLQASGADDSIELVNPYSFRAPISPHQAAEEEGRAIDIAVILDAFDNLKERHDFIVAEGAGGLLVPLGPGYLIADLVGELGLPLLVVARGAVGTINHTLLTVKHAESLGLEVAGIIINNEKPTPKTEAVSRPEDLARYTCVPLIGRFPYIEDSNPDLLKKALVENLSLSDLGLL